MALLPDLSGTVIESNAVLFDGAGMFLRPKGAKNSNDLASEFKWGNVVLTASTNGGGLGADCNGYPQNAFRYDTPTWGGFSVSCGYGEDDVWDVALKYAADWNSIKVSAAAGYTQITDEGCHAPGAFHGRAGLRQRRGCWWRRGARSRISGPGLPALPGWRVDHARSGGLFAYGLYQRRKTTAPSGRAGTSATISGVSAFCISTNSSRFRTTAAPPTRPTSWFVKAGIKRAWLPAGATVLWGEWGQYNDMFCGSAVTGRRSLAATGTACSIIPTGVVNAKGPFAKGVAVTDPVPS